MNANVDTSEIARFEALAAQWWDVRGEMAPLHVINPVRLGYLEQRCGSFKGKRVLDLGCGGGILSEALARAGASVIGIDLAKASIHVAIEHAKEHVGEQALDVDYRCISAEALAIEQPQGFDLVCCMEMLEHVPDPAQIVQACADLTRPGGDVMLSTINRNPKSYALMIVAAEYALRLLPRGTHEYAKFIRPAELHRWARNAGLEAAEMMGLRYNPLLKLASLTRDDLDVNYFMHCRKP